MDDSRTAEEDTNGVFGDGRRSGAEPVRREGMSQRQLGEASGDSKKTPLADAEVGEAHPRPSTARKIGAALEVDPRSLATVASRA